MNAQPIEKAHIDDYRTGIRSAVRGLWSGAITRGQFEDTMRSAIRRGQQFAFAEGAALCGIKPDEYSDAEVLRIQDAIDYEVQWIEGFADAIEQNPKGVGKLEPLFQRAEIWIGRYSGLRSEARVMACADKKFMWVFGQTEKHCASCSKLNGKVKRGSYWHDKGILPRVHGATYLECNGFRCDCELVPTDAPISRGALPRLP